MPHCVSTKLCHFTAKGVVRAARPFSHFNSGISERRPPLEHTVYQQTPSEESYQAWIKNVCYFFSCRISLPRVQSFAFGACEPSCAIFFLKKKFCCRHAMLRKKTGGGWGGVGLLRLFTLEVPH